MNFKLLFTLVILFSLTLSAQAQCKFKTNEADPFTSEKHLVSKNIRLEGDMKSNTEAKFYAITNLELIGSKAVWNFNFTELSVRDKNSVNAIKLRLKTKDGIIEILSQNNPDPKYTIEPYLKMSQFDFHFNLTPEQLKSLAGGVDIVGMEIFGDNKLFKTKTLSEISETAKCMLL